MPTQRSACICGEDHEFHEDVFNLLMMNIVLIGATVEITIVGTGTWRVPRVYLAAHGVKANELPEVAARYGFERVS